jgi:hypothetical protein
MEDGTRMPFHSTPTFSPLHVPKSSLRARVRVRVGARVRVRVRATQGLGLGLG